MDRHQVNQPDTGDNHSFSGQSSTGHSCSSHDNSNPFGRGWIPAERDIGIPGESDPRPVARKWAAPPPELRDDLRGRACPHNAFSPARRVHFLDVLAERGNVRAACETVGISPEAAYRARRRDFAFGEAWAAALAVARPAVEQVLADRAIDGIMEPVWFRGEVVGQRRRYDTRLLLAHLARLDRLVDETQAGRRAARFDELLAVVGGESFAPEMADAPADHRGQADPLLPMARERHVAETAGRAADEGREAAVDALIAEAESEGRDASQIVYMELAQPPLEPEAMARIEEAGQEAAAQAEAAAEAAWDEWAARVAAVEAMIDGLDEGTLEYEALDTVHSVNSVTLRGEHR